MQFVTVFMTGSVQPAALIDSDRVGHQRITIPLRNRMPHELRSVVAQVRGMFSVDIKHPVRCLVFEQRAKNFRRLKKVNGKRSRKRSRGPDGKAESGWIILRVDVFPALGAVRSERKLATGNSGRQVGSVLVVPHSGEVRMAKWITLQS